MPTPKPTPKPISSTRKRKAEESDEEEGSREAEPVQPPRSTSPSMSAGGDIHEAMQSCSIDDGDRADRTDDDEVEDVLGGMEGGGPKRADNDDIESSDRGEQEDEGERAVNAADSSEDLALVWPDGAVVGDDEEADDGASTRTEDEPDELEHDEDNYAPPSTEAGDRSMMDVDDEPLAAVEASSRPLDIATARGGSAATVVDDGPDAVKQEPARSRSKSAVPSLAFYPSKKQTLSKPVAGSSKLGSPPMDATEDQEENAEDVEIEVDDEPSVEKMEPSCVLRFFLCRSEY